MGDRESGRTVKAQVLDLILQSLGDGVLFADRQGGFAFWNRAMERLIPIEEDPGPPEAWIERFGIHGDDGVTPLPPDQLVTPRALRGETVDDELMFLRNDRCPLGTWVRVSGRPVKSSGGDIIGAAVVIRDVTDDQQRMSLRRALSSELKQSLEEARDAQQELQEQLYRAQKMEAIGQLAGGVAHDFNNLLTVILSYGGLLRDRLAGDERDDLDEILHAANRATDLTRQLLAFGRKQVMQPETVQLNDLVANTERMLRRLISENISWRTLLDSDAWPVHVDPVQIEQVMVNLAVNARDAMPEGGTLTIETRNVHLDERHAASHAGAKPGPHVMLSLADTGVGMTREVIDKIFDPFFTTKPQGKGTGLGLSTAYGVVKQSGGCIYVDSAPGRGTTFRLYFPRDETVLEPVAQSQVRPAPARQDATVLMVEDDAGVRRLSKRVLGAAGYRVLTARSGLQAMTLTNDRGGGIDVLVTDLIMPGMGGRELARRLAEANPSLRVLYISGHAEEDGAGGLDADMRFLPKPFSPDQLVRAVSEALTSAPHR